MIFWILAIKLYFNRISITITDYRFKLSLIAYILHIIMNNSSFKGLRDITLPVLIQSLIGYVQSIVLNTNHIKRLSFTTQSLEFLKFNCYMSMLIMCKRIYTKSWFTCKNWIVKTLLKKITITIITNFNKDHSTYSTLIYSF